MGADLADQAATKHLANRLLRMLPKLDILINNAGVMMPAKRTLTRDGLELMWAVNYFAGFIFNKRTDAATIAIGSCPCG